MTSPMRTASTITVLAAASLLGFTGADSRGLVGPAQRAVPNVSAEPFSLTGRQAEEVSVAVRFIGAFNARQLRQAVALLASNAVASDCDYRAVKAVEFRGRRDVTRWLRARFADRDRLTVARIGNGNPAQPTGVVGIEYSRRISRTLRALGFVAGIKPALASKVVFTEQGPIRILKFANGPVGGSPEFCRPS